MNFRRSTRFLRKQLVRRPLMAIILLLIFLYFCAATLIWLYDNQVTSFFQATTMIIPAFLGELGVLVGRPLITHVSVLVALASSVAFLAVITAKITSVFVEFCRRGGSIMKKVDLSSHIIICGWNFQGERIVGELLRSGAAAHQGIVLLADCETRPVKNENVEFVRGDPTQDASLFRAGIKKAKSIIVLSDLTKSANEADAEALMIVLAVESLNRQVHSCVQIVNSSNRVHFERAHADEIICLDQIGGNLVVASALNHGTSRVVSELLTFDFGSEFYRYDAPLSDELVGKKFCDAVAMLAERRMILLGFETDDSEELRQRLSSDILHSLEPEGRIIVVNPQAEYGIRRGDVLFLIAESVPTGL